MMPVVDVEGMWHPQAMSSERLSVWPCGILGKLSFDPMGIASRSLKATPLSMCARFGVQIKVREILGYHAAKDAVEPNADVVASMG